MNLETTSILKELDSTYKEPKFSFEKKEKKFDINDEIYRKNV